MHTVILSLNFACQRHSILGIKILKCDNSLLKMSFTAGHLPQKMKLTDYLTH